MLLRASASSLVATGVDGAAYQLALVLGLSYSAGAAAGAALGAAVNFTLNRTWAFPPSGRGVGAQVALYAVASGLTYLALQSCLMVFIEGLHVSARLAWVPAKVVAWGAVSYPLFRRIVFARPSGAALPPAGDGR